MLLSPLDLAIRKTHSPRVCDRAVMLLSARSFDAKFDRLYDLSGNGLHARLGSAVGADTNDPLRLQYRGFKEVYFPGSAGNYLSKTKYIPGAGVFRLEKRLLLSSFSSGVTQSLATVWTSGGDQRSWIFQINTINRLVFIVNSDGTATGSQTITSSEAITAAHNYIAVEVDFAAGTANYEVSADGVVWTALGLEQNFTPATPFNSTAALNIGTFNAGASNPFDGRFGYVRGFFNGAQVFGFNAANCVEPFATTADEVSGTWTLNRSATGRKLEVIDRDLFLFDGVDDYARVEDHPLLRVAAGPATVVMLCREYDIGPPNESNRLRIAKRQNLNASSAGYGIQASGTTLGRMVGGLSDGTTTYSPYTNTTAGYARLYALCLRPGLQVFYADGVNSITTSGVAPNTDNAEPLFIGRCSDGSHGAFAFIAAGVFRSVLSVDELARLKSEMLAL